MSTFERGDVVLQATNGLEEVAFGIGFHRFTQALLRCCQNRSGIELGDRLAPSLDQFLNGWKHIVGVATAVLITAPTLFLLLTAPLLLLLNATSTLFLLLTAPTLFLLNAASTQFLLIAAPARLLLLAAASSRGIG